MTQASSRLLHTRETQPAGPGRYLTPTEVTGRPRIAGKFFRVGDEKLYVRGVTYGTFGPDDEGCQYPEREVLERDFAMMAANGINAIRTYTVPPRWLLDTAQQSGLRVMVGVPWEQHVTFLDDSRRVESMVRRVHDEVSRCAGHPAVLCYAVGNEIPSPIVRWYGRRRVERFIKRLYRVAKAEDPTALVTYVNYPTTEYLELPFLDFLCFNVFLEEEERLRAYLARLQNKADHRPLLLAEIGLDSRSSGAEEQARSLDWQVRTAFGVGCAGAFVFSWTDEWHSGGREIEDWDFGLTDRNRVAKPALGVVRDAFRQVPFARDIRSPRISVAVCAYNAESNIRECLDRLLKVDYPDFEILVVDDGSSDETAAIVKEYDVRLISTENRGLSRARNVALAAATGEIIAYIDSDAYPDLDWLTYLADTFRRTEHVGVGGPNIVPFAVTGVEECVANAPGGPMHVLLTDENAEHIPGCNMAFRVDRLRQLGGFDVQYRIAGDDVDVCWRIQKRGWTLGFSPAAMVWHHRRDRVKAYWKQQFNYGRAEAMLELAWPEKYNQFGHPMWSGRLYGDGHSQPLRLRRGKVHYGVWGTGLFQSIYGPATGAIASFPLMPEWYLLVAALAALSLLGLLWGPLLFVLPAFLLAAAAPVLQAARSATRAKFFRPRRTLTRRLKRRLLTGWLHLMQPLARLLGRLSYDLSPWRPRGISGFTISLPRAISHWSEDWTAPERWIANLESTLRSHRVAVSRGGEFDRWDLEAWCGILGGVRVLTTVEEHGSGKQMVRYRVQPRFALIAVLVTVVLGILAVFAARDRTWLVFTVLAVGTLALGFRALFESSSAMRSVVHVVRKWGRH